jgi:flagellar secretion chaperone FliS
MSPQTARNSYRRAALIEPVTPEDPHAIIGLVLSELEAALKVLGAAASQGVALPSDPMARAMSAIYLLQGSLDFDAGGEIAPALFRIYEYCRVQILAAFRKEAGGAEGLELAIGYVGSIREAWASMERPAPSRAPQLHVAVG